MVSKIIAGELQMQYYHLKIQGGMSQQFLEQLPL